MFTEHVLQALPRNGGHSGLSDQSQSSGGHEHGWLNAHTWHQPAGPHGHGGYGVPTAHVGVQDSGALPGPDYGYGLPEASSYV